MKGEMGHGSSSKFLWYTLACALSVLLVGYFYTIGFSRKGDKMRVEVGEEWKQYVEKFGPDPARIEQKNLLLEINGLNRELANRRDEYKKTLEMQFRSYVDELYTRPTNESAGAYFRRSLRNVLQQLRKGTRERGVDMEDIGDYLIFKKEDIEHLDIDEPETFQRLQYLSIAHDIVMRAAQAKADQAQYDIDHKVPDSRQFTYMRILSLTYSPPRRTAPVKLTPNPEHKKWLDKRRDPATARYAGNEPPKFVGCYYDPFIVEYPIELDMICDDKSLVRFLASLQKGGKVLTVQRIRIVSPGIDLAPGGKQNKPKELENVSEQHIYVKISAVGQVFKPLGPDERWSPPQVLGSSVVYTPQARQKKEKVEFTEPMGY